MIFKNNILTVFILLAMIILSREAAAEAPLSGTEYKNIIGIGLATSYFKRSNGDTRYHRQQLKDFRARGFNNLRLRLAANYYDKNDDLIVLQQVIKDCLAEDIVPIISWLHEKSPSVEDITPPTNEAEWKILNDHRDDYVDWWRNVAQKTDGFSHRLALNLFTEISNGTAIEVTDIYNDWTRRAVAAIREVSPTRMIILASPSKTPNSLVNIAEDIYAGDEYMMAEWHSYASGPNQKGGKKNWLGNGSDTDKENVTDLINTATSFTTSSGLQTWVAAWMPMSNSFGHLTQIEVENFAQYFINELNSAGIPWTANAVSQYYDEDINNWLISNDYKHTIDDPDEPSTDTNRTRTLNMKTIVEVLVNSLPVASKEDRVVSIIVTLPADNISSTSAKIHFEVVNEGTDAPWVTLYWDLKDGGKSTNAWGQQLKISEQSSSNGFTLGQHQQTITSLEPSTTYWYRVRASNSAGFSWSNALSFTTLATENVPEPATIPVSDPEQEEHMSNTENSSGGCSHFLFLILFTILFVRTCPKYIK